MSKITSCEKCKLALLKNNAKKVLRLNQFIKVDFMNETELEINYHLDYIMLCPNCYKKMEIDDKKFIFREYKYYTDAPSGIDDDIYKMSWVCKFNKEKDFNN